MIAAQLEGKDWLKLVRAYHEAFWGEVRDIGNADVRQAIADAAGFDGAALEVHAQSDDVQAIWKSNYNVAKDAGVFGIPTFRYEDELYWGQDSLPFLDRHLNGEKILG